MKTTRMNPGITLGMAALSGLLLSPVLSAETTPDLARKERPPTAERARDSDAAPTERIQQARRRVAELQRAGKTDEAREMSRRIEEARRKRPTDAEKGGEREMARPPQAHENAMPPMEKIRHLREAAEHLMVAGYEKQAAMAREEAGRIEAEFRKKRQSMSDRPADPAAAMRAELVTLRSEMENLRGEVRRLTESRPMRNWGPRPVAPGPKGERPGNGR